ncbi:MAG: biotin--[acetyl-CoA-carboxylase] ligase [Novosphingobium sp.]|nr:biotin--[acetyl-CoA-carboxylase] ligase [Novosphingobium sp.]
MIQTLTETGSTNADLAARLSAGEYLPEGDWLVADRQVDGRGRQGRQWLDGQGNFMGSTVVHLRDGDPPAQTLALATAIALHQIVSQYLPHNLKAMLKWPNDILVDGAKLAGILLERVADSLIIGVGVNLKSAPDLPDRLAIALSQLGDVPDRHDFATKLADQFDIELDRWRSYGLAPIIARWLNAAHSLGTPLDVQTQDETRLNGTFAGLESDGSLQLRLADGTTTAIHAGEVLLAGNRD